MTTFRVEVAGQYKGDVCRRPKAASPWCWQRIETKLDGTTTPRGRETFRRFLDVKPWIARVCRVSPNAVVFIEQRGAP